MDAPAAATDPPASSCSAGGGDGHHGTSEHHGTNDHGLYGGGAATHKSYDFSKMKKKDYGKLMMKKGGIIEELKALALSKGIKSYENKEHLVRSILSKAVLQELKDFTKRHIL